MFARLAVLPDDAEPLQRSQIMAMLGMGSQIILLRHMAPHLGVAAELDRVLMAFAHGNSATAIERLSQLEESLTSRVGGGAGATIALRAAGRILAIRDALAQHASYFDAGWAR